MPRNRQKKPNEEPLVSGTAYRKVLAALADSGERYRILVEGIRRCAIYMMDRNGVIQTWTKGLQELLGYERDEIVGRSGEICFTAEDQAAGMFKKELTRTARFGESSADRVAVRKNGRRLAVNDLVTALHSSTGELIGYGKVTRERRAASAQDDPDAARDTEEQLARALALLHVETEHRRQLEAALLTAVEEERRRLGQDLHDDLCQHLGGVMMMASSLAKSIRAHVPKESDSAERLARLTADAIELARNLARGLHPVTLASHGLPAALGELAERVPLDVAFNWPKSKRLDLEASVALHLYRIAEEALANAVRHAKTKKITIELRSHAKRGVTLSIADNGKGFDQSIASEGMGLRNMRYRAGAIGGSLTIHAKPKEGTRVSCSVPAPDSRSSAVPIKRRKQIRRTP